MDCGNGIARQIEGYNICRCECQNGYWQNYNESGPCVDINECSLALNYSLCSYNTTCHNKAGNYTCDMKSQNSTLAIYNYLEMHDKEFPEQSFISPDISIVRKFNILLSMK